MSIFYNPQTKKPRLWTFLVFFLVTALVFLGVYLYGDHKAKGMPSEEPKNTIFEDSE